MSITVDESNVQAALGNPTADVAYEADEAELLVNGELAPHADSDDNTQGRLAKAGELIAAAAVHADGNGPLSSVTQGTAQISWASDNDDALTYWKRAVQMDPTGRLVVADKQTPSVKATGRKRRRY